MARKSKVNLWGDDVPPVINLPYDRALKAFAYANVTLPRIKQTLGSLYLVIPPEDTKILKSRVAQYRYEARKISKGMAFTASQIENAEINPFYAYIQSRITGVDTAYTRLVHKVMSECRLIGLRHPIDVMLHVGQADVEQMADTLAHLPSAPPVHWGIDEISIYRDFFWETRRMDQWSWKNYISWINIEKCPLPYLQEFVGHSRSELLWEAGLSLNISSSDAIARMKDTTIVLFDEAVRSRRHDQIRAYASTFRQLDASGRNSGGDSDQTARIASALTGLNLLIEDPGPTKRTTIDISQIRGTISDNEKVGQLDGLLEAERRNWDGFRERFDKENVPASVDIPLDDVLPD